MAFKVNSGVLVGRGRSGGGKGWHDWPRMTPVIERRPTLDIDRHPGNANTKRRQKVRWNRLSIVLTLPWHTPTAFRSQPISCRSEGILWNSDAGEEKNGRGTPFMLADLSRSRILSSVLEKTSSFEKFFFLLDKGRINVPWKVLKSDFCFTITTILTEKRFSFRPFCPELRLGQVRPS